MHNAGETTLIRGAVKTMEGFWQTVVEVWTTGLFGIGVGEVLASIAVFFLFLFARRLFSRFIIRTIKTLTKRTKSEIDDEILAAVGLTEQANGYARSLSGGMRRRLLVAKAMVHSPPVLVLDEPTAGVDIELRHKFWDYVGELNHSGTTILLTTHYLEEAERFCNAITAQ